MKSTRFVSYLISCFILIFGVSIRMFSPLADPPEDISWSGGYYADEGFWTHDARNYYLFGRYGDDEWHDRFVSPLIHPIIYSAFLLFGSGLFALRFWAQTASAIALIIFFLAVKKYSWGIKAFAFIASCSILIAYQKIALLETAVIPVCSVILLFWLISNKSSNCLWDTLSGCFAAAAFLVKNTQLYMLPVLIIATTFVSTGKQRIRRLVFQCIGIVAVTVPYYVTVYLPNSGIIQQYQTFYLSQHGSGIAQITKNIITQPFWLYFNQMPFIFMVAWIILGIILITRSLRKLPDPVLFSLIWFVSGLIMLAPMGYRPLRYYVPIIPSICILAGYFFSSDFHARFKDSLSFSRKFMLSLWVCLPIFANGIFGVDQLVLDSKILGLDFLNRIHVYKSFMLVFLGVVFAISIWIKRVWMNSRCVNGIFVLAIVFNLVQTGYWMKHRTFNVLNAAEYIAGLPSGSVIAGQWAPELCIESEHKAIPVWKNFVNDNNPFDKYNVTHVLSWCYPPQKSELELQREWFPLQMQYAVKAHSFRIKNSEVILWDLLKYRNEKSDLPITQRKIND
ncbi:glycosyltransferase family 39 protein [bacterium]|nr:glycosyltransferase family 39 protein [candidate division CSSED10-310 bacterium]